MTHRPPSSGARLFREPEERPEAVHTANIDGASRGNPGPAAYAVIVRGPDGCIAFESGRYIGRATNNVAEYYGLIAALDYATTHGAARLRVESDSELLVRQMQGRYKVKSPDLRPLYERARKLARGLEHFDIRHVPREANRDADALANRALDETSSHRSMSVAVAKPASERRVRARYSAGALHPLEALDLGEGQIVEITIRRNDRS